MIIGLRADKNTWHGHGRKFVFIAKKPMNVAIFYLVRAQFDEGVAPQANVVIVSCLVD